MKVFLDPTKAPLLNVPLAMRERRLSEIQQSLQESGLVLSDVVNADGSLNLSLKNMEARQRESLLPALEMLGVCRCDLAPGDLGWLNGGDDIFTHAISHGIASNVDAVTKCTTNLDPSELFDSLDRARGAVLNDRVESPELLELLRPEIEADMERSGLLEGRPHRTMEEYDHEWRAKNSAEPRPLSGEFADNQPPAYKSPFGEEF